MKFEPDLARQILITVEEFPSPYNDAPVEIDGYTQDEISYHVEMLTHANFLISREATTFGGFLWLPQRLTYEGHNFLAAVKKDTAWNKTKSLAVAGGKQISLAALKAAAAQLVKDGFGGV